MKESNGTKRGAAPRAKATRKPRRASTARPHDEQIRVRAYEIYLRRDGLPGDPADDWFRAERELIDEISAHA